VTLIPWILPSSVTAQSIWYNGQLLAVNDCLYRTSHAFNYVAFNDLDEFIVPHSAANWSLMIEQLMTTNTELDHQRSGQQSHRQRSVILVACVESNTLLCRFSKNLQGAAIKNDRAHKVLLLSNP